MKYLLLMFILTACGQAIEVPNNLTTNPTPSPTEDVITQFWLCGLNLESDTRANTVTDLGSNTILTNGSHTTGGPIIVNNMYMGYVPACTFTVDGYKTCDTSSKWGCL